MNQPVREGLGLPPPTQFLSLPCRDLATLLDFKADPNGVGIVWLR